MVASTRVQALTSKSEEVILLMEFIKDPALSAKLAEEVKKLNKLTDDEEKNLHEAKIMIQQRDTVARDLESKKSEMAKALADHTAQLQSSQEDHDNKMAEDRLALAKESAAISDRQRVNDEKETELRQKENQLKEKASIMRGLVGE